MMNQLATALAELRMTTDGPEAEAVLSRWAHINPSINTNQGSSYYHSDVSRVLREMGIHHKNERVLSHGLIVDIFIHSRWQKAGDQMQEDGSRRKSDGLILEIDGPTHYESYLQEPLGPTVMKRRHLRKLGYEVVSLPCTEYRLNDSLENKMIYMRNLLKKSLRNCHEYFKMI
jgi:hypothetical protein